MCVILNIYKNKNALLTILYNHYYIHFNELFIYIGFDSSVFFNFSNDIAGAFKDVAMFLFLVHCLN